ncbi:hypothetical protein KA005_02460 [bacterium]|nr:hypothetical protein [bacterium]
MTEKGQNYLDTRMYLLSVMKSAKQEDLIGALPKLDYHELKYIVATGVPGRAMHAAHEILHLRKDELDKLVKEQVGNIQVEYEDKTVEEKDNDELEGVRTS